MPPAKVRKRHSILIVEDSKSDVDSLCRAFGEYPIGVDVRTTAADALTALEAAPHKYTLVIVDVLLPDTNGEELVRSVRSTPELKHLILVALSAKKDKETVRKLYEAGANSYLSKNEGFPDKIAYFVHHYWLGITQLPPRGTS